MHRFGKIAAVLGLAVLACASPVRAASLHSEMFEFVWGTNVAGGLTITNNSISGWIEEVYTDVPAAVSTAVTGLVRVVYQPLISTMAEVPIYTNPVVLADVVARPRVDITTLGGAAVTADEPTRIVLAGETVLVTITNVSATTGRTWRVILKYENE